MFFILNISQKASVSSATISSCQGCWATAAAGADVGMMPLYRPVEWNREKKLLTSWYRPNDSTIFWPVTQARPYFGTPSQISSTSE